jgi:hypothetical protein
MSNNNLIDNEEQLKGDWIEAPAAQPGSPNGSPATAVPHDVPPLFSGSLSPYIQHDSSFVGTQVGKSRIPSNSLMPFGPQNNPQLNASVSSSITESGGGGGTVTKVPFSNITTGDNTGALMRVAGVSTLTYYETGIVNANEIGGIGVAENVPDHAGQLLISQPGNATAAWADPQVQGLYAAGDSIASPPAYTAPTTIQPVLIGAEDPDGLLQNVKVDDTGALVIASPAPDTVTVNALFGLLKELLIEQKKTNLILLSFVGASTSTKDYEIHGDE